MSNVKLKYCQFTLCDNVDRTLKCTLLANVAINCCRSLNNLILNVSYFFIDINIVVVHRLHVVELNVNYIYR